MIMIINVFTVAPFSKDHDKHCDSDDNDHSYHYSGTPF